MIKYLYDTDIFEEAKSGRYKVFMHSCNCFCTMGTGIAKGVKEHWPEAYEADCKTTKGDFSKIGSFTKALAHDVPNLEIYNLYTQCRYGRDKRYVNYGALSAALFNVDYHVDKSFPIITYPLSCGTAGGSWEIVSEIMEFFLPSHDITVVVNDRSILDG